MFFSGFATAQQLSMFKNFITAKGDRLYEGDQPFRFISYNIPNLLTIEDNMAFTETNAWRLPDQYEIEDALRTIKQMGGRVARTYVITVRRDTDNKDTPKFVEGPGRFNERAFREMDQVLAAANRIGVRLIIPFIDNWRWMGGRPQYAAFRGKSEDAFWTDQQLKDDYKTTVSFLLNRPNTVTGIAYKDDKAILAWELGNELRNAPVNWISEMAGYIKSIDRNHLINDGRQAGSIDDEIITIKDVDILSTHHYESNPDDMRAHIRESMQKAKGKKPYFVGEFGFISTSAIRTILTEIVHSQSVSGALIWSLRFHNRDGGFYWHSEPMGGGLYKAYHWPGFESGQAYDERSLMSLMRDFAFKIADQEIPEIGPPAAPYLLATEDISKISWQGSVGADRYIIERSNTSDGPWEIIATDVSDATVAYGPLYNDNTARIGQRYYYRVKAANAYGISPPSNVLGSINVNYLTVVDEMENYAVLYHHEGPINLESGSTRMFKEDFHRLNVKQGAKIIYFTPEPARKVIIHVYSPDENADLEISISQDGNAYDRIKSSLKNYFAGKQDYAYWYPLLIEADITGRAAHYIKMAFNDDCQIGRVEILHGP